MKLWIDADAAPGDVKQVAYRSALRLSLPTVLVANQPLATPRNNPFVTAVQVEGGPNVADAYIAEHAEAGDVAITADIPLAAKLVDKQVSVIDPRGTEYTAENVGHRLASRDLMDELRGSGVVTGGPRPFSAKDKQMFASALDRVLTKAMRSR